MTVKFSANVGFLWNDRPLPERIAAAGASGFDAVECHFPYEYSAGEVNGALSAAGIPMIGINTVLGAEGSGDFGVAALAGRESEAKGYIDQAIDYAIEIGARNVNVVAGLTGGSDDAEHVYRSNLAYACDRAAEVDKIILIEPLNRRAVDNYHVRRLEHVAATIGAVGAPNLKLMVDIFHTQITQGDVVENLTEYLDDIGHIQISAVHDRGEPDAGEISYPYVLGRLVEMGYDGYVGAEYKPRGSSVEEGLGWLEAFRAILN